MTSPEERPRRTVEVVSDTIGDTIAPVVAGAIAAAAVTTGNAELGFLSVPVGALSGALGKQGALLVITTLRDRADRVRRLFDDIADETGVPIEEFLDNHTRTDPQRRLLGEIVAAATDATSAWKIRTLAQAFVRGARDEARVDETLYFVALARPLEPAHARFLAVVAERWRQEIQESTYDDVLTADPGLGLATPLIGDQLIRERFLVTVPESAPVIRPSAIGLACARWLAEIGRSEQP